MTRIYVLVGPSGGGKTTLAKKALAKVRDISEPVNFTTRPQRPGEVAGKPYHFITKEWFLNKQSHGEFVEVNEYAGELYGITRREMDDRLAEGDVIVVAEGKGVQQLIDAYGERVFTIYVGVPELDVLRERLVARGGMSPEQIELRLSQVAEEAKFRNQANLAIWPDSEEAMFSILNEAIVRHRTGERFYYSNIG